MILDIIVIGIVVIATSQANRGFLWLYPDPAEQFTVQGRAAPEVDYGGGLGDCD